MQMQSMQVKVLQATHPDVILGMSTASLRDYYLWRQSGLQG